VWRKENKMFKYEPLNFLPTDFQTNWRAALQKATPTEKGVIRLVNIRRTEPRSFEEQRVIVLVVDENGLPIPNVKVAFSFSTAEHYTVGQDFLWAPPTPRQAFIVPTQGSGQIDQIQGGPVKQGEPGGVTVYILEPEFSSDVVTGAGMLADHTGMHLTFQLRRTGVTPLLERLANIEARLDALEAGG
jgi:hypothetical protein